MCLKALLLVICLIGISQQYKYTFETTTKCKKNRGEPVWCYEIIYYDGLANRVELARTNHHCLISYDLDGEKTKATVEIYHTAKMTFVSTIRHNCSNIGEETIWEKQYLSKTFDEREKPLVTVWELT